jgi:CRISPR-associated protein Csm2
LTTDIVRDLKYLDIQFAYQSGRDNDPKKPTGVKDFVTRSQLLEVLGAIKDKETLIRFTRYMEALVAYFKYEGGKEV